MFDAEVYTRRRRELRDAVGSGLILILGNEESPMNYPANPYKYRQDSNFLYFFGLESEGLAGVIDVDGGEEIIFGYDFTIDDIVWMGPQPSLAERAEKAGVEKSAPTGDLAAKVKAAVEKGRKIHFTPQYRPENRIKIGDMIGVHPDTVNDHASESLIKAIVAQRAIKSDYEVKEIEAALDIAYNMHTTAMRLSKPGLIERAVSGAIEGIALSEGNGVSFPIIFSVHGETLHNHYHGNKMKEGDIAVCDSGAESVMHYASDITRTIPVSGKFTDRQKDVYEIVLKAQMDAIDEIKPGVRYLDVHILACKVIAEGLIDLGIMKGNVSDAVESGAHALFMPHGLGHMMGLDVHDMEDLGENYVGYDEGIRRSDKFGLSALRLARKLKPGFVLTVEPGIYFIPELIDIWKSEKKHEQFIDYGKVEEYRGFGGIRIEDDVLVTETGRNVLGKPIPKTVDDVEQMCAG